MSLLSIVNLVHSYTAHRILDGATLSIDPGQKVGLVGRNGCGKSTLMQIIRGRLKQDGGQVQVQRNAQVGYLSQDPDLLPTDTVREAAGRAFSRLHELHDAMNSVYDEMATAEGDKLDRLLKRQVALEAEIDAAGGYVVDHKIDATLHGLGFVDEQFSLPVSALSGGQKGRLGLARLLLEAPDLLLLDEPTNHLDIAGREWLEGFLADEYRGAILVVSHDRWLLDRVVDRIVEIEQGAIREYPGNYHQYLELRKERQLTEARVYEKQLDRIRAEEQFISRYKAGQRAKQARGRQSRLERFKRDELVDRPIELEVMNLNLPKAPRSGDLVISAQQLCKRYGDLVLFENFDLTVQRGERIGIIGPNGIGKSTLIKCILGELAADSGEARLGSRVEVGYYRQLHEHLDLTLTVWQYLQSVIVGLDPNQPTKPSEQQARDLAGAFLFSKGEQEKVLGDMSGGERSRAVLAGLVAGARNLLILDEPTNHLDIPSAERLEQVLSTEGGYEGTLILITHDRALLDSTCDRLLVFEGNGRIRDFLGRYSDWELQQKAKSATTPTAASGCAKPNRQKAEETHRPDRQPVGPTAKLERLSMNDLERRIEQIEHRISEIDQSLIDSSVYGDGDKVRSLQHERDTLAQELEPLEFEWSRRAEAT